ncbi:TatD family hydrolase [Patescibacteria group bacterium]|nr:TatD family hydrolase [Patescibacteria group bacterium]MBU0963910.1 TatD family hydrolase [Patescibacteria group bacterium]
MLIDTHAHLNFSAFKDDGPDIIQQIVNDDMKVINVGSQLSTSKRAVELADKHQGNLYAAVGLHPIHLFAMDYDEMEMPFKTKKEDFSQEAYEKLAEHKNVVAIGETGLDYFHRPKDIAEMEFINKQKWTFLKELQLAKKLGLPYILHCRDSREKPGQAYKDILAVLKEFKYFKGVIHCFSSDWDIAAKFLDMGLMISFTGIITYPKTNELTRVVKKTPLDRIMAETDAPYLAPQIVRGKRNEPRFVRYIIDQIAEIKGKEFNEVNEAVTRNANQFFGLK